MRPTSPPASRTHIGARTDTNSDIKGRMHNPEEGGRYTQGALQLAYRSTSATAISIIGDGPSGDILAPQGATTE